LVTNKRKVTIMKSPDFSQIQRRTLDEMAGQASLVKRTQNFSLRELINSKLPKPEWKVNDAAMCAASELSESCRQASGKIPTGTWVPLGALTRDLTPAGSPQAVVGTVGNALQAGLATESAIMGAATILSGLSGSTYTLPSIATPVAGSSAWVAENAVAASGIDPTFKAGVLTPKTIAVQINVSRKLLMNSAVDLETELKAEILRRMLLAIDTSAISGTSANEPSGLLTNADLQILAAGTNGAAPTWANLVELEYQVGLRVGMMRSPAMITSAALRKKLRTTQRAAGLDFILPSDADRLLGHRLAISAGVPDNLVKGTSGAVCSALVFGDLAEFHVGFWGPVAVDLMVDAYSWSTSGNVRIIGHAEVGVAVRHAGAFCAFKDLLTA
jgi:HK97 family phage major capsid protein